MEEFTKVMDMIINEDMNTKVLLMGTPFDMPDPQEVITLLSNMDKITDFSGELDLRRHWFL